jgi:hypothetical protein
MQANATEKVWHGVCVGCSHKPLQNKDLRRRGAAPLHNPFIFKGLRQKLREKPPPEKHCKRKNAEHGKKYPVRNGFVAH